MPRWSAPATQTTPCSAIISTLCSAAIARAATCRSSGDIALGEGSFTSAAWLTAAAEGCLDTYPDRKDPVELWRPLGWWAKAGRVAALTLPPDRRSYEARPASVAAGTSFRRPVFTSNT